MQKLLEFLIVTTLLAGCASMDRHNSGTVFNSKVRVFPSSLVSEADFMNLGSADGIIREQAFRNVFVYYNCLVKATPDSYRRLDPTVLSRSEVVAFSEIPGKIHDARIEKLGSLVTDQNRSRMQNVIDAEIKDLSGVKWENIQKEVNALIAGARRDEVEKNSCPLPDSETEPQMMQLAQEWWLLKPVFIPPFM